VKLLANFALSFGVGWCIAGIVKAVRDENLSDRQKYAIWLVVFLGILGVLWL
jgi:hypothetical protein